MKYFTFQITVHFPKAKCYDTMLIEASGIRWAIENASKAIRAKHPSMTEKADFEIVTAEKVWHLRKNPLDSPRNQKWPWP